MPKLPAKGTWFKWLSPYLYVMGIALIATFLYRSSPGWTLALLAVIAIGLIILVIETSRPIGLAGRRRKVARAEGWNMIGVATVTAADPYVTIQAERGSDGIAIPVTAGDWAVHTRAAMGYDGEPQIRDMEIRIARDAHWLTTEMHLTGVREEPTVRAALGALAEVGMLPITSGNVIVHAGRRKKRREGLEITPNGPGTYRVCVARDDEGQIVSVVSNFQPQAAPIVGYTPEFK